MYGCYENFIEAAEKVAQKNSELENNFFNSLFFLLFNENHKIHGYFYPLFCNFSSFNFIIRFMLTKKSALAPWIVMPFFPQALAVS